MRIPRCGPFVSAFLAVCLAIPGLVKAIEPPSAAAFRSAFEAQFPKTAANGAALELESLAAPLGIDLAPKDAPKRTRPTDELVAAYVGPGDYVDGQLRGADERIGAPPEALVRFLAEHPGALDEIRSLLLRSEPRWEMDVTVGLRGPMPNVLGHMRLQRLLMARALLEARDGLADDAVGTLEASWRLNEELASHPELISHLIVLAVARLQAGVLRKVDSPAWGWSDRMRDRKLFAGYTAALENECWWSPDLRDLTGESGAFGRTLRRVGDAYRRRDLCEWTPGSLTRAWDDSYRAEFEEGEIEFVAPNLQDSFFRWRRYLLDAELTALILDARGERAASRRHLWPEKLSSLGTGVCPGRKWFYRAGKNGIATFGLEGDPMEPGSAPLRLPLTFTAGTPVIAPRKPGRPPDPVF